VKLGVDVGSTTAKVVLLNESGAIIFSRYIRHKARIRSCIQSLMQEVFDTFGDIPLQFAITGSAGMGIAEQLHFMFVQEVIASSEVVQSVFPDTQTLIDIGGEDAKLIFFEQGKVPDIRMNGSCAGGTGAFIDQIAALLNIPVEKLNEVAQGSTQIYPIASRCGVFAKTDVQNLISRKIPLADIAASAFHSIALQTINSLARGIDIAPKIMCVGGPLTFIPALQKAFFSVLALPQSDFIFPEHGEFFPAWGAALCAKDASEIMLSELLESLQKTSEKITTSRLEPLFADNAEFEHWKQNRSIIEIPHVKISQETAEVFVGIDSGSTTTKILFLTTDGSICASFYGTNKGKPVETVMQGLQECCEQLQVENIRVLRSCVTGYGEDLIRSAFSVDEGVVETIAHTTASLKILPNVSFILDIGGQDMKAMFLKDGFIQNIEINEACSSGCGSFLQSFAETLSYTPADFGNIACTAPNPCDLGSRCTVFMNSQVKQSLREGAEVSEIAAGLAYSVIKNALFKVLRINNMDVLGDAIMVQGGTFKNHSVFRAMQKLTRKPIYMSNVPELMGAFGAAYYAKEQYAITPEPTQMLDLTNLNAALVYDTKQIICKGCTNNCVVTRFLFHKSKIYYSGNKCEKIFSSKGSVTEYGENLYAYKYDLLFQRDLLPVITPRNIKIGIPRILGIYANFPFWNTLFTHIGCTVVLSDESNYKMFEKGQGTIMADNICFPAKLAHGHVINLVEKQVDRIFYPIVIYEEDEHADAHNSYNCPIVSSYSEVLESSISLEKRNQIPIDKPVITFKDETALKKNCWAYVKNLGVSRYIFSKAFKKALREQKNYREQYRLKGFRILERAKLDNKPIIMLAARPYHTDPLIHQKTSDILTELGASVITEEIVTHIDGFDLTEYLHIPQWNYPNRILKAAQWVINNTDYDVHFVQMNSFGCGPDSFICDEIKEMFEHTHASYTFIRVDEINSTGSMRLRLRSLVENIKIYTRTVQENVKIKRTPPFTINDTHKQIIAPFFTEFHSPFISPAFQLMGYRIESLPVSDTRSVELGLQYANNEICYPATLIVGDIIKALQSGKYDVDNTVVIMSQTGGQCRASNYLALIKKAVLHAGFENVPVISLATAEGMANEQPGFKVAWKKILKIALTGMVFGDILSRMHYATIVREKTPGATKILTQNYLDNAAELTRKNNVDGLLHLLSEAVKDYNDLALDNCKRPQVGIVGEIYLKYNPFANMFIADWLVGEGIEVRFPDLLDFFVQEFVNMRTNEKNSATSFRLGQKFFISFLEQKLLKFADKIEKIASDFKYYRPKHSIYEKAKHGSEIIDLANQFGEGWLIPAEIALFAKEGVHNVVSLQPFGCIANHIIAKGVEKKIKTLYPHTNLLFLDYDGGTSKVNVYNRLHFLVQHAKNQMKESEIEVISPITEPYYEN